MLRNPYNPASAAAADIFVGRAKLTNQLTSGLQNGLSYGLVGGPGMGKTSLLQTIQQALVAAQENVNSSQIPLPVYVSIGRDHKDLGEVLALIFQSAGESLMMQRNLPSPPVFEQWNEEARQGRLNYALKMLLNWAFEQEKAAHQPILLLDDLHRLDDKQLLYKLMSILQTAVNLQELKMALLLAGQHALTGELRNDTSPLRLLIARHYALDKLTREETKMLVSCATRYGWKIEAGSDDIAYSLTGGHPYRLHYCLCAILADEGELTCANLNTFHTSDTIIYLDTLLHDGTNSSQPPAQSSAAMDMETVNRVRELVREDQLKQALDVVSDVPRWQQDADLLAQQLSHILHQERQGVLTHDLVGAGRTKIAQAILKLLYPE